MTLTEQQQTERALDRYGRDEGEITEVIERKDTWGISAGSSGFGLAKKYSVEPKVGQKVTLYTHQGSMIHGIDLDGEPVFYKTRAEVDADREEAAKKREAEKKAEFERNREGIDASFAALPPEFQRRVQWFRDHNPDFRWEYEPYEMSCCTDAVRISEWARGKKGDPITRFDIMPGEKQKKAVPGLYDGHSGNSFGMCCRLARLYLISPILVVAEHGALTPLVGCVEYGCEHPREDDVLEAVEKEATW